MFNVLTIYFVVCRLLSSIQKCNIFLLNLVHLNIKRCKWFGNVFIDISDIIRHRNVI